MTQTDDRRNGFSLIHGIVFDMDGVLIDSEPVWEEVRRDYVVEHDGAWAPDSQSRMMGLSTPEWSRFVSQDLGVGKDPAVIATEVISRIAERYAQRIPVLPGAIDVVRQLAQSHPIGLASSSPRILINTVLEAMGIAREFTGTRSTEEEARGKPHPDVYLTVAGMLALRPQECLAVEDSTGGLRSAAAAGLIVVAVPQAAFPPSPDALKLAACVLPDLSALPAAVKDLSPEEDH
jgi:HAD superfamily hydrolase (TIGR01509 family)